MLVEMLYWTSEWHRLLQWQAYFLQIGRGNFRDGEDPIILVCDAMRANLLELQHLQWLYLRIAHANANADGVLLADLEEDEVTRKRIESVSATGGLKSSMGPALGTMVTLYPPRMIVLVQGPMNLLTIQILISVAQISKTRLISSATCT